MKTLSKTLLLCAGIAAAGAVQAQTTQYTHDLYGDWRVTYAAPAAKTADQVSAELAQAKANGQYTFGDEDYPPPVMSHQSETRAQVEQELQQRRSRGRWHPTRKTTLLPRWPTAAPLTSINTEAATAADPGVAPKYQGHTNSPPTGGGA